MSQIWRVSVEAGLEAERQLFDRVHAGDSEDGVDAVRLEQMDQRFAEGHRRLIP